MDRERAKQFVKRCMDKATDAELRAICMAAYHITKSYHELSCCAIKCKNFFKEGTPMNRDEMIDHIFDAVRSADTATVEQFYWFLMMEMEP